MRASALAVSVLLVGVLSAATIEHSPRAAAAIEPAAVAQEISLAGLTIGTQTVRGPRGVAEAFFPPPVAALSPSGTFVRVFFSHGPQVHAGAGMVVTVNGQPLTSVPLSRATAAGGVLEVRVPAAVVDRERPNRLQVMFDLGPATAAASASNDQLYGQVEPATLIHYSLAVSGASAPGLETYPYALLATDASSRSNPVLKVVLPSPPELTEAAAAFRILADLGRRAGTQRVRANVISAAQLTTPDAQGGGLLIVGRLDHLPGAIGALTAAGWRQAPEGWTAPDGRVAGPDDGLLATGVSPWDGRTPLLLVTGTSDQAMAHAASGLVTPGPIPLAGGSAIVSAANGRLPSAPVNDRVVELSGPSAVELAALTSGVFHADLSFLAPAVARDEAGRLDLTIPQLGPAAAVGQVDVAINGAAVATDGSGPAALRASFGGRLLRPGRNALSLNFRIEPKVGASSSLSGGAEDVIARLRLPGAPSTGPDLASLPFPFLDPSQPPSRLVLKDVAPATIAATVETAIALGHRAVQPPAPLEAALATDQAAVAGSASLLVLGSPAGSGPLRSIARALRLAASGQAAPAVLEEARVGTRTVLWLSGAAVAALYETDLSGRVAVVDATGHVSTVTAADPGPGAGGGGPGGPPARAAVGLLIAVTAVALLGIAVGQLIRAQRPNR